MLQLRSREFPIEWQSMAWIQIATGKIARIPNDFVFVLIGGESPDEFLRKTGIEIVEKALPLLN